MEKRGYGEDYINRYKMMTRYAFGRKGCSVSKNNVWKLAIIAPLCFFPVIISTMNSLV
jgi:hypothetical protein